VVVADRPWSSQSSHDPPARHADAAAFDNNAGDKRVVHYSYDTDTNDTNIGTTAMDNAHRVPPRKTSFSQMTTTPQSRCPNRVKQSKNS
jgi:hypothetical protein